MKLINGKVLTDVNFELRTIDKYNDYLMAKMITGQACLLNTRGRE
jgi:hypothetical protein